MRLPLKTQSQNFQPILSFNERCKPVYVSNRVLSFGLTYESDWANKYRQERHQPLARCSRRTTDVSVFQRRDFRAVEPDCTFPGIANSELKDEDDCDGGPLDRRGGWNCDQDDEDDHQRGHAHGAVQQSRSTAGAFNGKVERDAAESEEDGQNAGEQGNQRGFDA